MRTLPIALLLTSISPPAFAVRCDIHDLVSGDWRGTGRQSISQDLGGQTYSTAVGSLTCRFKFRLRGGVVDARAADIQNGVCHARDAAVDASGQPTQSVDRTVSEEAVFLERSPSACRFKAAVIVVRYADTGRIFYHVDDAYMSKVGGRPVALQLTGRLSLTPAANAVVGMWDLHLLNVR